MSPTPSRPNTFASGSLARLSERRKDEAWVSDLLASPQTQIHVVWQGRFAVRDDRAAPWPFDSVSDLVAHQRPVLLGELDRTHHFALDLSHVEQSALDERLPSDATLTNLRDVSARLDADHANLLAFASGITTWHARGRFCGACGTETEVREAGHMRRCPTCRAEHFPRTDPVVIMLVTRGDRCVLGRQKVWPKGFFSALAGFVEPGESLEDAVAREVSEEVGVEVAEVHYHSSQPWPFPQSLMVGFYATAASDELNPALDEIEEAHWFEAADLRANDGYPKMPPPSAIANRLIVDWMNSVA